MRPTQFHARELRRVLQRRRVATMSELKAALGTSSDATVFRKLRELSYLTSYSHSGRYYTLREIPEFNDRGLWCHRTVHFSRYGTLCSTAEAFVHEAEAGWRAKELEVLLEVSVKEALLVLWRQERIARERVGGSFLYCSRDSPVRRQQLLTRRTREIEVSLGSLPVAPTVSADELRAAVVLFFSLLDEKERRLYAGLESLKLGYGGDQKIAELLGLDVGTIARGRWQLTERDVELDRVRKRGGGRKAVEKKRPR